MNIALTGVVIFIFLFPGLIFRRFYYSGEFSKESFSESYFEVFYTSFFPSLFFYTLAILVVEYLLSYNVNFVILGNLLIAKESAIEAFELLDTDFLPIFIFHLCLYVFSAFSGFLLKKTVRYFKWDRYAKLFRYKNYWHYLINGEVFDFPRSAVHLSHNTPDDIEVIFVDALVETSEGTVIYRGLLADYELSKKGELESIYLTKVKRRYLKKDPAMKGQEQESDPSVLTKALRKIKTKEKKPTQPYYDVPGHLFVIPYSRIVNVNFSYYTLQELGEGVHELTLID